MAEPMNIVVLGLSITSSWGNGHATVWRSLLRALGRRGHHVLFLERDVPWYANSRDMPDPSFARTSLYSSLDELRERFGDAVRDADAVIVGSYVPEGVAVGRWVIDTARGVTAFYDIDTPVTLAKLERSDYEYIDPDLIGRYSVYLSFTGGPVLERIEQQFGSTAARPLYCCFDPELYYPEDLEARWDLGYMGTYSLDRQVRLEQMLLEPARRWRAGRFVVAGPQYPDDIDWPQNVRRLEHISPAEHRAFYNRQRFTLNVTRDDMIAAGYAPSVRLFEAAACATPIISDCWPGLETFFELEREILISRKPCDTLHYLSDVPDDQRLAIGLRARRKVLARHTAAHRARELEQHLTKAHDRLAATRREARSTPSSDMRREAPAMTTTNNHTNAKPRPEPVALRQHINELGPWFHNLHLPDGMQTAPDHFLGDFPSFKWRQIADHLPQNLEDWEVLDIGCNAGFYSLELAKRGARVLGIDHDERYLAQARWAAELLGLDERIDYERMQVYDLARLDRQFDLVLFMGVFYHLRYPLLGLDIVAEKVRRLMVFQTLTMPGMAVHEPADDLDIADRAAMLEPGWPTMAFIEKRLAGDPTNWWAANHAAVEAMLRSTGLAVIGRPGHEIYLCEPACDGAGHAARSWDQAELRAATGRSAAETAAIQH